jgi:ubiquinone/menaquinone biosynthesis C-methylase UbiE
VTTGQRYVDVGRFGRWADSYNESRLQRLVFAPLQEFTLHEAAAALPAPRAILDVGCGTGLLLHQATRLFPQAELTGVDPAPEMVDVAQSSVPEGIPVRFVLGAAEALPFAAASFDLVFTTMSFHHWADQPKALAEVRRVLAPRGLFVLTDALPVGWLRFVFTRGGHGRFNKPSTLVAMLRAAHLPVERHVAAPGFGGTVHVVLARAAPLLRLEGKT